MKVLHIAHSVYPLAQAGTEIYTAALARALSKAGLEVTIAIPSYALLGEVGRAVADQLDPNVRVIPMSPGGWWGNKIRALTLRRPLWQTELSRLVRSFRPDVVHVQHPVGFGLSVLRLLGAEGLPMVVTLPDYWLLCEGILRRCQGDRWRCAGECRPGGRRSAMGRLMGFGRVWLRQRRVARYVRRYRPKLAAISESTRQTFLRAGFPADLLVTRPWGIDEAPFRDISSPGRLSQLRIGYLGSMRPHKGCHVLLEAFGRLAQSAELHFHGSGDEQYMTHLRAGAAGRAVYFHGRYDHEDVPAILAGLDVIVIPSVWDETYCLVYQEALAARRPVIASRVGGLSDRVIHGVNGFLVPPGDASALAHEISNVLDSYGQVQNRLDYDRSMVTLDEDAREWIKLYTQAIAGSPTRRRRASGCGHRPGHLEHTRSAG